MPACASPASQKRKAGDSDEASYLPDQLSESPSLRVLLISIIVVVLDQITKLAVRFFFEYGRPHKVLGEILRLTYIENPGMAFGIQIEGQIFFTLFASVATLVILVYLYRARAEKYSFRFALAMILGGAIGNLIDRFLYGKVVDFIDIGLRNSRWPIFNIADSAVTIGLFVLIGVFAFDRDSKNPNENEIPIESEFE